MSFRLTSAENTTAIYDSVTGLPLNIEIFEDDNEAEAFLTWALETSDDDLRELGVASALQGLWYEHLHEQWEKDFYEPVFRAPECPLCGKALGNETQVHKACADYEAMLADLTPSRVRGEYYQAVASGSIPNSPESFEQFRKEVGA